LKVIMLMAVTLDGRTAKNPYHFPDWTGKEDKKLFADITKKAGVVIYGARTFDTIKKALPERKNIVMTRNIKRISESENPEFTDKSPEAILQDLEKQGFEEAVICGGAYINTLFAKKNLIDEIIVTISPLIFGTGLSLFTEDILMELELKETKPLGKNLIFARYIVIRT